MSKTENLAKLHAAVARHVPEAERAQMEKFLTNIMANESGGSLTAKNDKSSATGLFQFIKSTWAHYSGGASIYDADAQCDAAVRFALDNAKALEPVLGRPLTAGEYYLAHFAGLGGARAILKSPNTKPIRDVLTHDAMDSNSDIRLEKGSGKYFGSFTVGDIKHWANRKMGVVNTAFDGLEKNAGDDAANDNLIGVLLQLFTGVFQGLVGMLAGIGKSTDQNSVAAPFNLAVKKAPAQTHSPS